MMRYSDIESFVHAGLTALEYDPVPVLNPGPNTDPEVQKRSPNAMVFLTVGGGSGLTTEQLFDLPFIIVRAVGKQHDFLSAETLAWDLDKLLLSVTSNTVIGTAKTLYINRTGAAPQLLLRDTADRYHFQCTYITETQTGF